MKRGGFLISSIILIILAAASPDRRLFSQSVYAWDVKKDIILGALSIGVFISPFFVENAPDHIPGSLNKDDVNVLDRSVMFSYHRPLDLVSDYGVYGMLLLPALSVIGNIHDADALISYAIMYTEAFLLTFGTKDLLKNCIIRFRPYMYEGGVPGGREEDYYNSFPSGSTALAFLGAAFLSTTFSQEYPESKWKLPIIIGSYTLAAGVAAMRIASGSHFVTDVLAGAGIGAFYGWALPFVHKKRRAGGVSVNFTGDGFLISLIL